MERSIEMILGWLAVLKAGGASVPLDPTYPDQRLAFILQDTHVQVLLTQERLRQQIPASAAHVLALEDVWETLVSQSDQDPTSPVSLEHLAYIIYTSGSTGVPKGVQVTHRGLGNLGLAQADAFAIRADSRVLQFASLNFDASVSEILMTLLAGGTLHLEQATHMLPGTDLLQVLQEQAITCVTLPPSALEVLPTSDALPTLQTLVVAGEACPVELMATWAQGRRFFNAYGPTEATVCASIAPYSEAGLALDPNQNVLSLGRPLTNTQFYILDRYLQPVPLGVPGEIYLGGVGLARGYLHHPDLTAERFIPDPFAPVGGTRLYRTGDLARHRADGTIEYIGRIDSQVKLRGYRIELGEIEAVLSQHPSIRECVVVLREEGQDLPLSARKYLAAYVVAQDGKSPTDELVSQVQGYLRERLTDYMIPTRVVFLESMPLTPNGKVDRKALPEIGDLAQRNQNETLMAPSCGANPQATMLQELLVPIWKDILGVRTQVGIHDNFFELGGHSLLVAQVIARIRQILGMDLPLRSLFDTPTIAALASHLEGLMRRAPSYDVLPLGPMERPIDLPLSFAQERLWFLNQWDQSSASYNVPMAFRVEGGQLHVQALERSLAKVVQRHEVLRTTFDTREGQPIQIIAPYGAADLPQATIQIPVIDLRGWPATERDQQVTQLARAEAQRPFDLAHGPLLRVRLLRTGALGIVPCADPVPTDEQEYILLFTLHHIVTDGWSMGVLVREITALYQAELLSVPSSGSRKDIDSRRPTRGKVYSPNPNESSGNALEAKPSPLPALPLQYADYAIWQREQLQAEILEGQLAYWRRQLSGAALLQLPTDHPRPPVQRYRGAHQSLLVSPELLQQLKSLSQREGVTLFMTLLATFDVLLMRYNGQSDIVVGTPIANRWPVGRGPAPSLQDLIGFFVNTVVLRTDLSGNPSFLQLLARVREVALQAYMHQDIPFEKLVEELQPERDLSRQPLFQVLFSFQTIEASPTIGTNPTIGASPMATIPGLSFYPIQVESQTTKFDLSLMLSEEQAGLQTVVEYNTDLFDAATMIRLLRHWQMLLETIVHNPGQAIETLLLLTEAEREQLLVEWNATHGDYPRDVCVHQFFEQQVERTPDSLALVFEDELLTYAELNRQANLLASHLQGLGVGPEVLVGICMERSIEMVIGLLAVLKAAGAYVPLDPKLPQQRLTWTLEDAQVPVVLTQTHLHDRFSLPTVGSIYLESDISILLSPTLEARDNPPCPVQPDHLAYLIYTSGSTGQPKGVQIPHHALINFLLAMKRQLGIEASDTLLAVTSLSFDIAGLELFLPLVTGARVVIASREMAMDGAQLAHALREHGTTLMQATPSTWSILLQAGWQASSTMRVLCGGEAFPPDLARQLLNVGGEVWNLYGPTETTIWSTAYPVGTRTGAVGTELAPVRFPENGPLPIGRPIANTQIYLLDRNLEPVPIGVPGELYIGGEGLARGYNRRPELTAERFIPNPFVRAAPNASGTRHTGYSTSPSPGERLYRTGDLARYLPDGTIEYLGRIDQQVKLRGYRIELGEIEATLRAYPGVQEAVVVLREEDETRKYLVAYVVARGVTGSPSDRKGRDGVNPSATQRHLDVARGSSARRGVDEGLAPSRPLRSPGHHAANRDPKFAPTGLTPFTPTAPVLQRYLREQLPDYMVPTTIAFLESVPLTPNGKVDRKALSESGDPPRQSLLWGGALGHNETLVAPHTPLQELLVTIWQEVLHLSQVGIHDNFFDLGGHSLLATQLMARVRAVLAVEMPLQMVFEEPTVARFATRVEQALRQSQGVLMPPLVAVVRPEEIPLSFAQQRLWFLDQLAPGNTAYLIPGTYRLLGKLNVQSLDHSLRELIKRHESLRTTFAEQGGKPIQVIHPASGREQAPSLLPVIDLQGLRPEHREAQTQELARQEAHHPCDLTKGPLLRARLLRLVAQQVQGKESTPMASQEHVLLFTLHHIVFDGWSMEVLMREIITLYQAEINGEPVGQAQESGASPDPTFPTLPDLPLQYADYTLWQQQWLQGEVLDAQIAYWRRQLTGAPALLNLPTDRPRPAVPSYAGAQQSRLLSPELLQQLKSLSQQENATLFMTLLAVFNVVLYHYTGQDDLVVGTDIANRNQIEVEHLIGFFVNQLVLRTDLSGNPPFLEVIRRVRKMSLEAYAHQDLPFERLVEALSPKRDLSHTPLFQVKLLLQNVPTQEPSLGQGQFTSLVQDLQATLTVKPVTFERGSSQFDLILKLSESDYGLFVWLEYRTDLFNADTMTRFLQQFEHVIRQVVALPDRQLDELEAVLAAADREEHAKQEQEFRQVSLQKLKRVRQDRDLKKPRVN
jgi:amino acid adenylation domain-containing protein